jgi:protein-disulfide isomerase
MNKQTLIDKILFFLIVVIGLCLIIVMILLTVQSRSLRDSDLTATAMPAPSVAPEAIPETMELFKQTIPSVRETDVVIGDIATAQIVLLQYTDLECPFCQKLHDSIAQLQRHYGEHLAVVYRHFPLERHPEAANQAEVVVCADEQGDKFSSRLVDATFNRTKVQQQSFNREQFLLIATETRVNMRRLEQCLESGRGAQRVADDKEEGKSLGVRATPTSFLYNKKGETVKVSGAQSLQEFQQAIDYLMR